MDILDELKWRDAINQVTDVEGLNKMIQSENVGAYVGIDPTGDSMHIGHLIPFMILKRFQLVGVRPVIVIGGATGSIGDPSGKKQERKLLEQNDVDQNVKKITKQMEQLFGKNGFTVINNKNWLGEIKLLDFLRNYGKFFPINVMLAKDVVSSRLEAGISFTEFTYQILQAIDFHYLWKNEHVRLQIGGSDQWGNITGGIDLIHRLEGTDSKAYGLTVPLLLKSDGTKFGKTEGNAIWLDSKKTTSFEFYQFWLNVSDSDVEKMLKYFTFLSQEKIIELMNQMKMDASQRKAQICLAQEVTKFVHGEQALKTAELVTSILFGNENVANLKLEDVAALADNVPTFKYNGSKINIVDLIVISGLESSKTAARRAVNEGAIRINGIQIKDDNVEIDSTSSYEGKYIIMKRGKKKWAVGVINK